MNEKLKVAVTFPVTPDIENFFRLKALTKTRAQKAFFANFALFLITGAFNQPGGVLDDIIKSFEAYKEIWKTREWSLGLKPS